MHAAVRACASALIWEKQSHSSSAALVIAAVVPMAHPMLRSSVLTKAVPAAPYTCAGEHT
jgi:hypothetical protein